MCTLRNGYTAIVVIFYNLCAVFLNQFFQLRIFCQLSWKHVKEDQGSIACRGEHCAREVLAGDECNGAQVEQPHFVMLAALASPFG